MVSIHKQKYKIYKKDYLVDPTMEKYNKYQEHKQLYLLSKAKLFYRKMLQGGGNNVIIKVTTNGITKSFDVTHDDNDDIIKGNFGSIFNDICIEAKNEKYSDLRKIICRLHEDSKLEDIFDVKMIGNEISLTEKITSKKVKVQYNIDCMHDLSFGGITTIDIYPNMTKEDIEKSITNNVLNIINNNETIKNKYGQLNPEKYYNRLLYDISPNDPPLFDQDIYDLVNFKFDIKINNDNITADGYSSIISHASPSLLNSYSIFNDHEINNELLPDMINFNLSTKAKGITNMPNFTISNILSGFQQIFNILEPKIKKIDRYEFVNKYINSLHKLVVSLVKSCSKGSFLVMYFFREVTEIVNFYWAILIIMYWSDFKFMHGVIESPEKFVELLENYINSILGIVYKIFNMDRMQPEYFLEKCINDIKLQSKQVVQQFSNEISERDKKNPFFLNVIQYITR